MCYLGMVTLVMAHYIAILSSGTYPFRPLNCPPSTMHKQKVAKIFGEYSTSLM